MDQHVKEEESAKTKMKCCSCGGTCNISTVQCSSSDLHSREGAEKELYEPEEEGQDADHNALFEGDGTGGPLLPNLYRELDHSHYAARIRLSFMERHAQCVRVGVPQLRSSRVTEQVAHFCQTCIAHSIICNIHTVRQEFGSHSWNDTPSAFVLAFHSCALRG